MFKIQAVYKKNKDYIFPLDPQSHNLLLLDIEQQYILIYKASLANDCFNSYRMFCSETGRYTTPGSNERKAR